jgi:hypothetical protein
MSSAYTAGRCICRASHWPERPFRFGLGLESVRRETARRGFRLAGLDGSRGVGRGSAASGFGVVSTRQNFLILSVMRMPSMVYRPFR